jgi:4-hydroxy-tetrahydrodipicolinate reductase
LSGLRVTVLGLGAIGRALTRELLKHGELTVVAAADPSPAIAGKELAEVVEDAPRGITVAASAQAAYQAAASDVAVLCTGSYVPDVAPQVAAALEAGRAVVTTCEELANPALHATRELDALARRLGHAVLATGVNPGLVMDRLPLLLAQACVRIDRVLVRRRVDVSKRRVELQRKVGAGISVAEFEAKVKTGRFGHVGLRESAYLVAAGIALTVAHTEESLGPVVADVERNGVPAGEALGMRQRIALRDANGRQVVLELEMSLGLPSPADEVEIDGDPPARLRIDGGLMGDRATLGTVINALRIVRDAAPGVHDVTTLPLFGVLR